MSEPEDCIEALDTWIQSEKNMIYDENIKGPDNSNEVLENYSNSVESFGRKLIYAIKREDINLLQDLNWPDTLLDCIKDSSIQTVIVDRIENWCIQYPYVKSKLHINELAQENAGVN